MSEEVWADGGGLVDVRLPETPSSGYRWELETPEAAGVSSPAEPGVVEPGVVEPGVVEPGAVEVVATRFDDAPGEAVGSQGTRIFSLRLIEPIEARLTFALRRVWEPRSVERREVVVRLPTPPGA